MTQPTYYDILGISLSADTEIIDAAYHALTKKYKHNPNAAHRLVQIRKAYETLSDPIKRADYDSWLQMNARFSRTTPPNFGTQTTHSPIQTTDDYRPHEPPKPKKSSLTSWLVGLLIAMIAVVILAYFLVSSAGFFGHRDEPVTPLNHDTPNSSIPKLVAIEPMIPFTPDEITPEQRASYEHAHAAYLAAVNRINAVWNNLPKTIQDELRDEQRSINSTREEVCKAQAASQYSHPMDIDTARYQCEVPRLDERTETLRIYAANVADQPTLFYDPSYPNQPTYSDHSNHLEGYTPSEALPYTMMLLPILTPFGMSYLTRRNHCCVTNSEPSMPTVNDTAKSMPKIPITTVMIKRSHAIYAKWHCCMSVPKSLVSIIKF